MIQALTTLPTWVLLLGVTCTCLHLASWYCHFTAWLIGRKLRQPRPLQINAGPLYYAGLLDTAPPPAPVVPTLAGPCRACRILAPRWVKFVPTPTSFWLEPHN